MDIFKIKWFNHKYIINTEELILLSYGYDINNRYIIQDNYLKKYNFSCKNKQFLHDDVYKESNSLKYLDKNEINYILLNSKTSNIYEFNKITDRLSKIKILKNK